MEKEKVNRLVVGDVGWAETLPDWLLEAIEVERVTLGVARVVDKGVPEVGNAELCAYLYTASLHAPMSAEHSNIYFWIGASVMRQHKPDQKLPEIMTEALERGLTKYEFKELRELRAMIFRKRGGEIAHPVLDFMRILKKEVEKAERDPQLSFF